MYQKVAHRLHEQIVVLTFQLSQLEHVLKRPDSYIGSVEAITQMMWVLNPETKGMVMRCVVKCIIYLILISEIPLSYRDSSRSSTRFSSMPPTTRRAVWAGSGMRSYQINDPTMDVIKVNIDREKNQISVYNSGRGIPIEMHKKEGIMIPELIFGNLYAFPRPRTRDFDVQLDIEQLRR